MYELLMAALTGTNFDRLQTKYERLRRRLYSFKTLLGPPPEFLNNCDTLYDIWRSQVTRNNLNSYESRREFLRKNFKSHYENILSQNVDKSFEEELIYRDIALDNQIDEGGFGVIYKAEHIIFSEPRIVKKLEPIFATEEGEIVALRRFAREIKILSTLNHNNIVKIYDAGLASQYPYFIMEYIHGKNLEKLVRDSGVTSIEESIEIVSQILNAVSEAHKIEIIHRDIKPKNIMWNGNKAVLLDYGAGQWLEHRISTRMTTSVVGTVGYIADELFDDPTLLHKSLDCYSIGVLFHYLLTGHLPHSGDPTYYLKQSDINTEIQNFILKAISPITVRYQDGSEMLASLNQL